MKHKPVVPHAIFFVAPEWEYRNLPPEHASAPAFDQALETASRAQCTALLIAPEVSNLHPFGDLIDDPDRVSDETQRALGTNDLIAVIGKRAAQAKSERTTLLLDVDIIHVAALGAFARRWAHAYRLPAVAGAIDPRLSLHDAARARILVKEDGRVDQDLLSEWIDRLASWLDAGATGLRLRHLAELPVADAHALIAGVRAKCPEALLLGETPGLEPDRLAALRGSGLDAVFSSLPWWDNHSPWLVEENDRLKRMAPVVIALATIDEADNAVTIRRKLWAAAMTGDSIMIAGKVQTKRTLATIADVFKSHRFLDPTSGDLRLLCGSSLGVTALIRGGGSAATTQGDIDGRMLVINPSTDHVARINWPTLRARLPGGYSTLALMTTSRSAAVALPDTLAPGEVLPLRVLRSAPVTQKTGGASAKQALIDALVAPRAAIESITPNVDNGRFALKRTVGEPIEVQADVFMDGGDAITVDVLWRAVDEIGWHSVPMTHLGNDRYCGIFAPTRIGRHQYKVRAWRDTWTTYHNELSKKHGAGLNLALELEEGRILVAQAHSRRTNSQALSDKLGALLNAIGKPASARAKARSAAKRTPTTIPEMNLEHVALLLTDGTARLMAQADDRPFLSESDQTFPVNVERQAARFASWYELLPRSQSGSPDRHGTFDDVINRLPAIRDMGFDVLYFPPIHPIGLSHRKGKNNTLNAGADQPGSPYAIGSQAGGHDAVHPELGTLADFQKLVAAAHAHGLEIALDFAIQCSPDHPWLTSQPDWFSWRADGSMRYAENPPKKYEDIVNVDFYSTTASTQKQIALWRALRDVIVFWIEQGVRTFRVDNPHTKPLPFWEWMIADVQARHPGAIFLSEAFTRPKMMYRLAKAGFSQSYTYFTWREHKQEISDYLIELNRVPARDIFRPNFFVNTPDINPRFLQRSGRAGHLIRMALATTTSGLWGLYSGFELCEARPVVGKEEYLNSEKYELRAWDWNRPGNIVTEITAMNLIRRHNPALQTHLGLTLQTVYNDQILLFLKATPEQDNVLLIAVNLDPFNTQSGDFELPLWTFGLGDDAALHVSDLLGGNELVWRGKRQTLMLTLDRPYAVWRLNGPA